MTINCRRENATLTIAVEGRLDTATAPTLEAKLKESYDGLEKLIFDFEKLDYISSAGLRVLLTAQKQMTRQGSMVVRHVNGVIDEILEVTGFKDILKIE